MALKLCDGSDGSDNDEQDLSKIEINEEFARRYEHNKKRADLQRYEELKKKGIVDSASGSEEELSEEEEDEEDLVNASKKDLEFFNALIKVRTDPQLKSKQVKLFESESESEDEEKGNGNKNEKKKKKKPMYLKDVTAKHLIEEGPEFEEKVQEKKIMSYAQEQEQLRKEFLDAAENAFDSDDDEGEFLKVKNGNEDDNADENDGEIDQKIDEYFGDEDKLDENEKFLKDYFRKKMWLDKDNGENKGLELDGDYFGVSEDEEEIEKQEDYERDFNFRFEENAGDRVMGHSRVVEGSVRKKTNARKLQRKSKEERLAQGEFERREELKHLKNLKKKEMNEKLKKIRQTAGIGDEGVCLLDVDDLEEEFDPEEYDIKMKKAFDDDYYKANDADPEFGSDKDEDGSELEKPDFDKEDELLGLPKGWDDAYGSGDGFSAARKRVLKHRMDNEGGEDQVKKEEEMASEEDRPKKKRKGSRLEEEVLNKDLEEYYKLDYEDTIGDLKTRFKYRPVNSNTYHLTTEEILAMNDKELNQYVSIKKMAPYRESEWKVHPSKRQIQKQMNKSLLKGESSHGQNIGRKSLRDDDKRSAKLLGATKSEKPQTEVQNSDQNSLSKKSRRKRRQADLKLSLSRRIAYGLMPPKPKSKKKR